MVAVEGVVPQLKVLGQQLAELAVLIVDEIRNKTRIATFHVNRALDLGPVYQTFATICRCRMVLEKRKFIVRLTDKIIGLNQL